MLKAPIDVLLNAVIGLLKAFIRGYKLFVYLWYIFIKLF